jgi:formimidoylglutamate deiminase
MITLAADYALLDDGFVRDVRIGVAGGVIAAVTRGAAQPHDERVAGVLLPGMGNLHSHAFQRIFAGRSEHTQGGADFWSWRDAMYRAAAAMTPQHYAPVMAWLGKELLKGGYTAHAEFHYLHNQPDGSAYAPPTAMAEALAAGAAQSGIALTLLLGVYETAGFDGAPLHGGQLRFRNNVASARHMADALAPGHSDVGVGLALHSLRAVPPASLAAAVRDFAGHGPIHIHVAEQRAEVAACVATLGAPPVAWLLDHAPVDPSWCLVHATHATAAEITAAARTGAVIGLCPSTEADLGDGIYDFPTHVRAGGRFGIGSDSNVMLDAFAELRLLEYGQRLRAERRNVAAGATHHCGRALWQEAAAGGAAACGRAAGRIAPGHRADFVVIEATPETAGAAPDFVLDAAIFSPLRAPARHVMVGGGWLVRDGVHRNEAAIDTAYEAALQALSQ